MKFIRSLAHAAAILLVVVAALYLFVGALLEGRVKRDAGRTVIAIAAVSEPTPQVFVATRDGSLYSFRLADSTWHACGSLPRAFTR